MARTRHVFGTDQIAHLWAHQTQSSARNAQGNFYFEGDTIYSYGSHFPIARILTKGKGKKLQRAVVMTTRTRSNTTAKHIHLVRGSIPPDYPKFTTQNIYANPRDILTEYTARISDLITSAKSRRSEARKQWDVREACNLVAEARAMAKWFHLSIAKWNKSLPKFPGIDHTKLADQSLAATERRVRLRATRDARWLAIDEKRTAERAAIEAEFARTLPDRIAAWRRGEHVYSASGFPGTLLRIESDETKRLIPRENAGHIVRTSRGTVVPLSDARRAFAIYDRIRQSSPDATWKREGLASIPLGPFFLDAINTDGSIRAGCHEISAEEIAQFALSLVQWDATHATTPQTPPISETGSEEVNPE